jgi:hypothetical protein
VESDAVVECLEEDGDVVLCSVDRPSSAWGRRRRSQWTTGQELTVKERGKVAAEELVLCVTKNVGYGCIAMQNCALLGEDEDGDVDELGDDGIGPALLAGELELPLLGAGCWLGRLLVLRVLRVLLLVGEGGVEGRVDRDWVLH